MAVVDGTPEIVGGVFVVGIGAGVVAAVTCIEKAGNDVIKTPSETLTTTPLEVPTLTATGDPASTPVAVSKVAHAGAFWTLKVSKSPSGSEAWGVKL